MWSSTTIPALAIVLSALSFIPSISATVPLEGYGRDDYPVSCAQACSYAMPSNLDCPEYAGMTAEEKAAAYPSAACFANDTSYLTSMAYCIHTYCPKSVKLYKIEYFWEVKMIYGSEALTIRWPYPEALAQVNTTTAPKPLSPEETVFNRTISIDATTYQSYMNGVKGYKAVAKNESMYSILAFMTCVMVPIGFSLLRFLPLPTSFRSKVYGYLIDPPAWGRQHSVATLGIGMVPTRGQALFILYLIGINCLATFAGYPNYTPNGIFPDRHYELMRHIGNRAGSVAFANIPVVILYAGRSSVLLRLTNWSYSTFLLLHRWTATICVVQVALHSLLWLRIMIEGDSYPLVLTYPYWYVGIVGTVAFSALIPFSMLPIRKIVYEVFLITHIVLTIGALVGSWYHIVFLYEGKGGFEIWLIIAFCFWGLERLLRILRISRYGIKKAYVTRIDDKYLRVDIPDVDAQGHCFAYFPTLSWRVWENHPFSIVNCSKGQLDGESIISSSASHTQSENEGAISPTEASASKEMGGAMSNIRQLRVHSNTTKPGITLFVQNLRGMTAKLAKKADAGIAIPVLIESSYGHEDSTRFEPNIEYPNTLVISGGVGIAGVLSSLQASLSMYAKPLGNTKLYWGIKSKGLVDVVKSMIVGGDATEEKEGESSNWGHIETHISVGERMDIKRVLTTELENAIGGTTVVVCGPHAMCDEARLDAFVLNVGYPKLDWVSETLSHLYSYADDLISKGGGFKLALSLDQYATGAWCYDKKLGDDCGGPKEYETILKSFLGPDSHLRYGPNNFPFITSFSTGRQTDKDFIAWKKSFANEMYFVPGIDDTLGFWESHPAWWQYWSDIIDGANIKVMGPLQKKGKAFMMPISMLQYKNAYGANLYRRGEMNVVKRMENILSMDPQPDIIQILTWNDGPESHHFGNLWPEQITDAQPNQYASPDGSDHTALQSLYSAFIYAWKNGGSMVPAFSKRDEAIPQRALWHKSIFQSTTCPGGAAGAIGAYAFDDAKGSPGGTIVFCSGFFAPGQEHLAAVQRELDADRTKQKDSIFTTGKFRLMIHELVHLPSVSHNLIGSGKESDVIIKDQYIGADQQTNSNRVYMPEMVEKLARMRTRRYLTAVNADTYAWYTVESFFTAIYGQPPNGELTGRDDEDPTTTSSAPPEPQPTEQPTTYDCKGSGICSLNTFQVKYCDHAINSLIRNAEKNYGDGKALSGDCWGDSTGTGCGVFVTGKGCVLSGSEMWWKYPDLRDDNKGGCGKCRSVHYGNGCRFTVNYQTNCDNR
ncbi:ferric reductase Fre2p [Fusarium mundagurra]|uniref:Ferric reductase Fre2p n=1 Tax=Fusarium mundagurra TaxID=1567541 RepID=A0A8H6DI78_9HYPO|nr:ferric reductase Fre2p [Fusarium mundagurra]